MTSKERCLSAIKGGKTDRTPVFPLLMFFAQQRAGITYREFASNFRSLVHAQENIYEKFKVDALTVCSDAFRVSADLGAEMVFPEDKPPFAASPLIKTENDLRKLAKPDPLEGGSRMADRIMAIEMMVKDAGKECLVLGWIDMPFAEACSVCGVSEFMILLMEQPILAHKILRFLTDVVIDFAVAQLNAGAPMIGAGDAAASLISPQQYREFSLPYEQEIIKQIHAKGGMVKLHICGNTSHLIDDIIKSGADLFNVDHLVPFQSACDKYGNANVCFKGNLNPVADIMQSTPEDCERKCIELINLAKGKRYMLSAGCEIPAETPDEVFAAFCNAPCKV